MGATRAIRPPVWVIAACILSLAACQSASSRGALSAAEARRVEADFARPAVPAPPKTIDDIVHLARTVRGSDNVASKVAKADERPPAAAGADALATFYYERSLAARHVGRAKQRIEDLTLALGYAQQTVSPSYPILHELTWAEAEGGNVFRALEANVVLRPGPESVFTPALRAQMQARVDEIDAARRSIEDAERALVLIRLGARHRTVDWRMFLAAAHALLLEKTGRYAEAEAVWRAAHELALEQPSLAIVAGSYDAAVSRMLLRQDRLTEAEHHARRSVTRALGLRGLQSAPAGFALRHLAAALRAQGRLPEAETIARLSVEAYEAAAALPDSLSRASAYAELARALTAQGRDAEALREYETVIAGLGRDPRSLDLFFKWDIDYARLLRKRGSHARALELLRASLERSRRLMGDDHRETAEIRAALAQARAAAGDVAGALSDFRAAAPILLTHASDEESSTARPLTADARLDALGAYVALLADVKGTPHERAAMAEAFVVADGARGRAVQQALDASAVRAAAQRPELADTIRQMQDGRRRLRALYRELGEVAGRERNVVAALTARLDTERVLLRTLTGRVEIEFPAYAEITDPKPVTLERARALLRPGEALITTLVTRERTFVWAVPATGTPAFVAVPLGAVELERTIAGLRRSLEPNAKTLGDIPDFDVNGAHALYRQLLEPVRAGWSEAHSLLIVAHGPLAQLPLGVLPTRALAAPAERGLLFSNYREVPWLARTHAITVLPSVGSLVTLRALPAGDTARRAFAGFGDPWFSRAQTEAQIIAAGATARDVAVTTRSRPITLRSARRTVDTTELGKLPPLPDTAPEILAIAAATKADVSRDVFLGPRANEAAVKTADLATYRIVAFATHGLLPGELTGLTQPALALSAPEIAGIEGDGVLTTDEILGLRLDADWIVLSACNTAGPAGTGAEAISGLGRAFFYAGARALLVSNWPVETTSARALTTALFRQRPALSRSEALYATQRWMIEQGEHVDAATGKAVFSYAHPIFWAPFSLVGDGGGAVAGRP